MTGEACAEMRLLIQAEHDGELGSADAARIAAHLQDCADCRQTRAALTRVSSRLRHELPYYSASAAQHASLRARIAAMTEPEPNAVPAPAGGRRRWTGWLAAPFGAGFALAAALALAFLPPRGPGFPDSLVADHIRALQPGHLMDVVSTDHHTVKPWFDGRIDFAPPVRDFRTEGFPLTGGRLDYLGGRTVAVLIYQRRKHVIEVYVSPDPAGASHAASAGSRAGYNFIGWDDGAMRFWAVSDVEPEELAEFARLWRR